MYMTFILLPRKDLGMPMTTTVICRRLVPPNLVNIRIYGYPCSPYKMGQYLYRTDVTLPIYLSHVDDVC